MIYFSTFILALFVTLVLIPILTRLALRKHVVDRPGPRKVHTLPMPKLGGLAIAIGTLSPIIIWVDFAAEIKGLVAGMIIIIILGLLDDFYDLNYREKFIGQFIAVSIAIFLSKIYINKLGSLWGGRFGPATLGIHPINYPIYSRGHKCHKPCRWIRWIGRRGQCSKLWLHCLSSLYK